MSPEAQGMEAGCRPPSSSWRTDSPSTEWNVPTAPPTGDRRPAGSSRHSTRSCTSAVVPGSAGMEQPTRSWNRSKRTDWRWFRSRCQSSDVAEYYEGFSNATLWPLYHDAIATPQFHREWWDTYVKVNQRFADRTAKVAADERGGLGSGLPAAAGSADVASTAPRPEDRVLPPHSLSSHRALRPTSVAAANLEGLLGADLVGFQLPGGAQNFVRLVRQPARPGDACGIGSGCRTAARCWRGHIRLPSTPRRLNELAATEEADRACG